MDRSNNLDGLRLLGSVMVIIGHAYAILGRPPGTEPQMLGYSINTLGVVIFFAISGYLIAASWNSKRDLLAFMAARCLRIFPALVVLVVATAFVIGPLATSRTVADYFGDPLVLRYLRNIALHHENVLPGVLDGLPYPASINGSLWTLPMEFACYLLVPLLVLRFWRGRVLLLSGIIVFFVWASVQPRGTFDIIWGVDPVRFAKFAALFMAGSLIRALVERYGKQILRADVAIGLLTFHMLVLSVAPERIPYISFATLPYVVLVIGLAKTPYFHRASRFGDLSYGMYLWAFPVQQLIVLWVGTPRMAINIPLVILITGTLAFLSWHLVEKPSMGLKDKIVDLRVRDRKTAPEPEKQPAA